MWHDPAVAPFDPALYLRLLGERALLDRRERGHGERSRLFEAASALVAVDAVDAAVAQEIVEDYQLAAALRSEGQGAFLALRRAHRATAPPAAAPLTPKRVVPCFTAFEHQVGEIEVKTVSLGEDAITLAVTIRGSAQPPRSRRSRGGTRFFGFGGGGPMSLRVVDDAGGSASAHFGGGGSDEEWRGQFTTSGPLNPATAWIEVDGHRIDLDADPIPVTVTIEPLPEQSPAVAYLWHRIAVGNRFQHPSEPVEVAIETLIAAGALTLPALEIDQVRAAAGSLGYGPHGRGGPGSAFPASRLPDPWPSLLAALSARRAPARGVVGFGAVTPPFEGITVAAAGLEADDDGFSIEVEVSPRLASLGPMDEPALGQPSIAWWARDDRGNAYLGEIHGWSSDSVSSRAQMHFMPPLDAAARRLDFMPTATRTRAVMAIPLEWADEPRRLDRTEPG